MSYITRKLKKLDISWNNFFDVKMKANFASQTKVSFNVIFKNIKLIMQWLKNDN